MKIAILGAGAMGSAIGALLHKAGHQATLIDVSRPAIEAVQSRALIIQNKAGEQETVRIAITDQPVSVGVVDLLLVFVKCYHTETAVKNALPIIGPDTTVLSLQNGWGNGPRIASIVGQERVVLGVCYHSATVLAPGHVLHAGQGKTFMGELNGSDSPRLQQIVKTFNDAGIVVEPSGQVLQEIWSKLALNVATLPTSSTVRVTADRLLGAPEMQDLMKELLREVVAVANVSLTNWSAAMKKPLITVDPEIHSGTPVFTGTRVPVKTLFDHLEAGDSLEVFLDDFPSVSRELAVAVLEEAHAALIPDAHPA